MTPQANGQPREKSYYEVMGLDPTCTPEELKTRYRDLAREHHPDQLGHLSSAAQAESASAMATINEAYDTLREPSLRRAYDQRLQAETMAQESRRSSAPPSPPNVRSSLGSSSPSSSEERCALARRTREDRRTSAKLLSRHAAPRALCPEGSREASPPSENSMPHTPREMSPRLSNSASGSLVALPK